MVHQQVLTLHPSVFVGGPQLLHALPGKIHFSFDFLLRCYVHVFLILRLDIKLDLLRNKSIKAFLLLLLLLAEIQHEIVVHRLLEGVVLQPLLISVLLRLEDLVRQSQILCDDVRSFFFLLLDLSHQILDHRFLGFKLEAELLIRADRLPTFLEHLHVNFADIVHFLYCLDQGFVLSS